MKSKAKREKQEKGGRKEGGGVGNMQSEMSFISVRDEIKASTEY